MLDTGEKNVTDLKSQETNLKLKTEKNNEKDQQSIDKLWHDILQSNKRISAL